MVRSLGWLAWTIVAYLLAAGAYELTLALRHSSGEKDLVWGLAVLAMLFGAVLTFRRVPATALFAPAAAFFAVARFYTGDPYFDDGNRSTFRSYADGGNVSTTWIYVVVGGAQVAGVTTAVWRRTAPVETAFVLLLLALTTMFTGLH